MRIETTALITKGFCLLTGGMAAAVAAGVTQIDLGVMFGVSVKVWALLLGAYSVGCNLLVAFLSQSFGDWKAQRPINGNGNGPGTTLQSETVTVQTVNKPVEPPKPTI